MGAKTWMIVYAGANAREALRPRPQLNREATEKLATALFPAEKLEREGEGDLSYTCPPDDEIHIGCFAGVSVVAGMDYPSRLPTSFIAAGSNGTVRGTRQ